MADGLGSKEQESQCFENKAEKGLPKREGRESRASLLLYGLDLNESEIQQLELEFNDLTNFRSVTNEDLEDIGIKNADKRAALLERLKTFPEPRGKEHREVIHPLRPDESLKILEEDKQHLKALQSLLVYLKKAREDVKYTEGGLLDNDWSVEDAIKAVTKISIREAELLCDRIQEFQETLQQEKLKESSSVQKRTRHYLGWTLGFILVAVSGVVFWKRYYPRLNN